MGMSGDTGSAEKDLEQKVNAEKTIAQPVPVEAVEVLPLEEYVTRFTNRYSGEPSFQETVHKHLKLGGWRKRKLKLSKFFWRSRYKKQTDEIIKEYATKIREESVDAYKLQQELISLRKSEEELKSKAEGVIKTVETKDTTEEEVLRLQNKKAEELTEAEKAILAKKEEEERIKREQEEEIKRKTEAKALVQEQLKKFISNSPLVQVDNGVVKFDENKLTEKLSDLFLAEIVAGIEKDDGVGFMSKVKSNYESAITFHDQIEDLTELPDVDWVQSTIFSRTEGYEYPTYPFLMSGKRSLQMERGKVSIDTAICLDTSGSMKGDRMAIASKTTLATHALMRQLNPKNNTFLAHYSENLYPLTPPELAKMGENDPIGGTATYKALDWLLETLKDKPVGIAYLITDGAPCNAANDAIELTIEAAEKFKAHTNISLRIFFIDAGIDEETMTEEQIKEVKARQEIVRKFGMAAGPNTKIIPVEDYQLASGMIKDVDQAIQGIYSIAEWK